MEWNQRINFPPFSLDLVNECLWRDGQSTRLAPKEFALLQYLLERPGRLVTKEDLIEAVWPDTTVTDAVLKVSIWKIRSALGDDPTAPEFIETVHRRGYRFIASIEEPQSLDASQTTAEKLPAAETVFPADAPEPRSYPPSHNPIGRQPTLADLRLLLVRARRGERQIVFITGEAGIGKTTVVDAFLSELAADGHTWIAHGQCLEQYGPGEAYLAVLEAISRLCGQPPHSSFVDILRRQAPTWLQQLPWLIGEHDRESVQRSVIGATKERMLREMAEALETLTAQTPLVLVLEDMHWSDYSTLDLVAYLARRRESARLLLVATYRPVDVAVTEHPLRRVKQELQSHHQCEELALDYLPLEEMNEYLAVRFPRHDFPPALTETLLERTDGNPLFLVNAVDYLQARGAIQESNGVWRLTLPVTELRMGVPESIRQMIEKQIDRLDRDQQRMLEVAAVAGPEFAAAAVSAGLEQDIVQIEEQCQELERRHLFLHSRGESTFPDGTVAARYAFIHSLYQEVFYQRVSAGRRARFHQLIGEHGERLYGEQAWQVAGELAMHFEQGGDFRGTVKYLRLAAENHFRSYAYREAIAYLERALEFVERLPQNERIQRHIQVLEQSGAARRSMGDMAGSSSDFEALVQYAEAHGRTDEAVKGLMHLATAVSWVDIDRCLAATQRCFDLIGGSTDPVLLSQVGGFNGYWHIVILGWSDTHAAALAASVADTGNSGDRIMLGLHLARLSLVECLRSNYQTAICNAEEAIHLALELSDPHTYFLSGYYEAWALLHLGEWGKMSTILAHGLEMAERNCHERSCVLNRMELAWLHLEAFDFEGAREICLQGGYRARLIEDSYTESLALILLARANLGLARRDAARDCLDKAGTILERERGLLGWVLRMLLYHASARYWLARRDAARARENAAKLFELAGPAGERTYLALAHLTFADAAALESDLPTAESEIARSFAALKGAKAPLAELPLRRSAAALYERQGLTAQAEEERRLGLEIIDQLAGNLVAFDQSDQLRQSLLCSGVARELGLRRCTSSAGRA